MNPPSAPSKRDFIGKPAPPGYVAGIGRGAAGFTTRSDIGPARGAFASSSNSGSTSGSLADDRRVVKRLNEDEREDDYLNESNYDEFAGYGGSLFNKDPYEEDDEEADKIYEQIDKHLDERGKALREAKTRQELEVYRKERPEIKQQFSDLKANLKQVSIDEWMNIPDVGDARNRKQRVARQDKFTPIPDSLLAHQVKLASGGEKVVYIDPKTIDSPMEEDDEPNTGQLSTQAMPTNEPSVNIGEMSEFRSSYMSMKLSSISNPVDRRKAADPQDYLTNLQSMVPSQITDASTLKEYRKQFASLRASNPTFANAWIASVRLEEAAGKLKAARKLILEACAECPKSPDLWCEAVRLHPPDFAKGLMVDALKSNPRSVKLWIKAADLETSDEMKRQTYRKARELIPKSILLWKKSVELEKPEEARKILRESVECCPEAVELWLALARLVPYEEAQIVLAKASDKNPTDRSIWLMAAKLQEAAGNKELIKKLVVRCIEQLTEKGVEINRDDWLKEAADAENANFIETCREIIERIIGFNIGDSDKLGTWLNDTRKFVACKSFECARAVFEKITSDKAYRKMESVWLSYAEFERQYGSPLSLQNVLERAIKEENCIDSETLWLMRSDELKNDLANARQILEKAHDANPGSEKIIIAAVDLECDNGEYEEARRILSAARKSAQLSMKSAKLEWSLGNIEAATEKLNAGINEYKNCPEFYLVLGQIEEQRGKNEEAKAHYSKGLKYNPTSVDLWISLARIEEKTGFVAKARSKLEAARLRNPKIPLLYLEAAKLEVRDHLKKNRSNSNSTIALTIIAKGIKECKGHPDIELLFKEQALISKRKLV